MPFLYPAEVAVSLLAPPLCYLWVSLTARGRSTLPRTAFFHFLLPAAWLALAAVLLLRGERVGSNVAPIEAVMILQMTYTAFAAWRIFGQSPAPEARAGELTLARLTVALFVLIHVAQIIRWVSDAPMVRHIVPVTGALVVFALTGLAVRRSRLFEAREEEPPRPKYEQSTLTEEVAASGLERLRRAMDDRVFLRPDLTLAELADEIGVPRSHLSQLVNERCGKSFPELLAEHRVEEARRLLADRSLDHLKVESVGGRAGFKSRSAFFEAFKKATGKTPAAYRQDRSRE